MSRSLDTRYIESRDRLTMSYRKGQFSIQNGDTQEQFSVSVTSGSFDLGDTSLHEAIIEGVARARAAGNGPMASDILRLVLSRSIAGNAMLTFYNPDGTDSHIPLDYNKIVPPPSLSTRR